MLLSWEQLHSPPKYTIRNLRVNPHPSLSCPQSNQKLSISLHFQDHQIISCSYYHLDNFHTLLISLKAFTCLSSHSSLKEPSKTNMITSPKICQPIINALRIKNERSSWCGLCRSCVIWGLLIALGSSNNPLSFPIIYGQTTFYYFPKHK